MAHRGVVPHHLRSLPGVFELTFCVHLYKKVGYFDAQIMGDSTIQVRGLISLPLWKNATDYLHGIQIMKHLAFFTISTTPSLKYIAHISRHSFSPNQLIFVIFHISTLFGMINAVSMSAMKYTYDISVTNSNCFAKY